MRVRDFLWFLCFCVVLAAGIEVLDVVSDGWPGWRLTLRDFAISILFSVEIGGLCWMTIPWVARWVCRWHPFSRWSIIVATLVAAASGGTWLAVTVASLFGVKLPYGDALTGSIPITLIVGVVLTLIESSNARLQRAELDLRMQQVERERAEKLAAEAQLASLTSRVHPHFLFNTLNSISALIREDPAKAEQMIGQLSSLLRGSLDTANAIPLETEMKLVGDYLEIQRARFGDRLRFAVDWSQEAVNGATVPPFSVQTVVENAVKHVAGQRAEGVALQVNAHREGPDLLVEVADNGEGFGPEALKAGHGLDNLQARLRALYGERGALEFDRALDGMVVRMRLPAV